MVKKLYLFVTLALVLVVVGVAGCLEGGEEATPTPIATQPTPTPTPIVTQAPVTTPEMSCLMCHKNAADLDAHQHGGDKCTQCHKNPGGTAGDVHGLHPESKVPCKTCHGTPPTIPQPVGTYTVCENCHGYPDATTSVEGNLVKIHEPRGKVCTVCHVGDVSVIHSGKAKVIE